MPFAPPRLAPGPGEIIAIDADDGEAFLAHTPPPRGLRPPPPDIVAPAPADRDVAAMFRNERQFGFIAGMPVGLALGILITIPGAPELLAHVLTLGWLT